MKAEHYHPNPAVRRGREAAANILGGKVGGRPEHNEAPGHDEHGPVSRTEVEHNKATGKHIVKAHHEDGHVATSEHNSPKEAHDHAAGLMGDGDSKTDTPDEISAESADEGEAQGHEMAEHEGGEDNGEETCPNCGHEMEQGGTCPQCGYSDEEGKGGGAAAGDEDEAD